MPDKHRTLSGSRTSLDLKWLKGSKTVVVAARLELSVINVRQVSHATPQCDQPRTPADYHSTNLGASRPKTPGVPCKCSGHEALMGCKRHKCCDKWRQHLKYSCRLFA
jgi:hypothetical protein